MYLLLCVALLGSALGTPLIEPNARNEDLAARYRLPGESRPMFYDVELFLDPDQPAYFTGKVSIRILANVVTNRLVLHAMAMEIESLTVVNEPTNQALEATYDLATDDTELLTINLGTNINPNIPHTVNIEYRGQYAASMFGVYVSSYTTDQGTRNLVTSQLQPTFARRAFPCYDEPYLKAIFRTTIYAPAAFPVVRSNMPLRTTPLKPDVPGYVKHEFEDTEIMSTYLIAYLVSDFDFIENNENSIYDIPFKIFSRRGTQRTAEYALDFGQRNMVALEDYTEMKYAFPKIDKAAVPDFAAGAMENWGLVIYREVALLVQDGVTTTNIRQNVARIVCHENVHMWFGNEVSPQSWTYTWLNEGFANFFENFATDLVFSHYRMMDQFILLLQNVMQSDAVLSVNPMTHPVYTPSQIIGTFNAVAYQKSGSVIRMMQHFMTPEVFRQGLVLYLRENSRKAAVPADLYAALQTALNDNNRTLPWPLATIMTRWTEQGGFPVLRVRRLAPTANSISVSQERFLTDSSLSSNDQWHVPLNWVLSTDRDFSDTSAQAWLPISNTAQSFNIPGFSEAEWFIVNKQQTGYYRVNYDPENWEALAKVLNENLEYIHVLNRAQILDDSFNLARNGRLDYVHPLEISRYLVKEKDYIPWGSANAALSYLDVVLSGTEVYNLFQYYMLNLTAPLFDELGFLPNELDEHVTAYHRNIVLDINCRYGNEICVDRAQEMLENFRNDPDQRPLPDIQTTVFCSGLRGGSADNFNFLWQQYLSSTDASQQSILLNSLGCTPNEELIDFYLNQVIDDNSAVREQDRHTIIVAVINSSPSNMERALDFVLENFHLIQPRVQGLTGTTNILNAFSRRLTTAEHNAVIDRFVETHGSIFSAGEAASVAAIRENIAASITWTEENLETVETWLEENFGYEDDNDSASAITSSLIVSLSIFLAFFNR